MLSDLKFWQSGQASASSAAADLGQSCAGDKGFYQKIWHSNMTPANFIHHD
jgi:hypothetical protein